MHSLSVIETSIGAFLCDLFYWTKALGSVAQIVLHHQCMINDCVHCTCGHSEPEDIRLLLERSVAEMGQSVLLMVPPCSLCSSCRIDICGPGGTSLLKVLLPSSPNQRSSALCLNEDTQSHL